MGKSLNVRQIAAETLIRIFKDKSYSGLVLNNALESVPESERPFISRLVYGVIERQITLDYALDKFIKDKKRVSTEIRTILRLGAYQLIYMDNIPKFAAINETVEVVDLFVKGGAKPLKGFVNGVLREIERALEKDKSGFGGGLFSDLPEGLKGLSIELSFPFHLLNMWEKSYGGYGSDFVKNLAAASNETPPTFIRLNSGLVSELEFEKKMAEYGITFKKNSHLKGCYQLFDTKSVKLLAQFHKNWYYHQDTASQISCQALDIKAGDRVADVCAAPGGKSFTTALNMRDSGVIRSYDVHRFKVDEMKRRAEQLEIKSIETFCRDASEPHKTEHLGYFDKVICDVPCSGLGVIRRKPEIKYKELDSFKELPQLQYEILANSAKLVRPGGIIQYSTCTLNLKENERVVERFLTEHSNFKPENLKISWVFDMMNYCNSYEITLFPHIHGTDGFYIAQLRRTD